MVGISFAAIFVRAALPAPPVVTGFYRMLFASALLALWCVATRRRAPLPRRDVLLALASGVCFGTDIALWHTALVHTSVATATLLVNTTPVHVGLYWILVRGERLRTGFVAGACLAILGAAVLLGIGWQDVRAVRGAWLALAAGVFYAGYLIAMSSARRGVDAAPALLLMSSAAAATLGLYALLLGDPLTGHPASSWAAMAGAALVSQVGGLMAIVWSLRFLPATLASVSLLAQPIGTALLGWGLLGEAIGPLQALGAVAVLAGISLAARSTREHIRR